MRDDFLTRDWSDQHARLSDAISRLLCTVRTSLDRLHAKQFEAPWRQVRRERCG